MPSQGASSQFRIEWPEEPVLNVPEVRQSTKNSFIHFEAAGVSPCQRNRNRCLSDATHHRRAPSDAGSDTTAETVPSTPPRPPAVQSSLALDAAAGMVYDPLTRAWLPPQHAEVAAPWPPATAPMGGAPLGGAFYFTGPPMGYPAAMGPPQAPMAAAMQRRSSQVSDASDEAWKSKKRTREVPAADAAEITLMVRNIPNKYQPQSLLQQFEEYRRDITFFYLPIDFKNKCNLGYAFINFRSRQVASAFADSVQNSKLPGFERSEKVVLVQPARVQGLAANVKRFRNSSVMGVLPEDAKPMIFEDGVQRPFPMPMKKLPPVGPRFRSGEQ